MLNLAVMSFAQNPSNVLIYHDVWSGYGQTVVTVAGTLWPSANIEDYDGFNQEGFNTALHSLGAGWDIIVIESWFRSAETLDWIAVNDLYDTGAINLYVSTWEWNLGTPAMQALGNDMGVSSFTTWGHPVVPHYAWDTEHNITEGISDWGWTGIPSFLVLYCKLTVSDAIPVTGWTAAETAGEAGICVANDGISVISGYTPAVANENDAIWENILTFLWNGTTLERDTWGGIKASF